MPFPKISCRLFVILSMFPPAATAQWNTAGQLDTFHWYDGQKLIGRSGPAILSVQILADDLVRVRLNPRGVFGADHSWAVVKSSWEAHTTTIADSPNAVIVRTPILQIVIEKKPLRISFLDSSGSPICVDDSDRGMSWTGNEVRVWKNMPQDEEYLGFGEKAGTLFRRGTDMTMWNTDFPGYGPDTDPLYETIPFFLALRNGRSYGIFFDNTRRSSFDMGKELAHAYSFGADGGEIDYYFFGGPSMKTILSRYSELVGHMPLPPRWALGYQQSRWSYPTEKRVLEIARGFRNRSIPCDVIYLDIDYMDGYRIFTWNKENFPDPQRMISDLSKDGFKIAVIVDPGIKMDSGYAAFRSGLAGDQFVRSPDGRLFTGKVWPGVCAFPDFSSDRARAWWGNNFDGLVRAGVRGWWNDMNEPSVFDVPTHTIDLDVVHDNAGFHGSQAEIHNVYGMQMTRATREGVQQLTPDERVFVLTRASYAGGQRYAAVWTGDNVATWEHLGMALRMCLNLSVSGQPFVGSDIGGFIGYPSGELFSRWLELGVFTPLMRAHSEINEPNKEPWEYGADFTEINRKTISLRYTFLPYIYTVMHEASEEGTPAMRPMIVEFPSDARFLTVDDAFMFGGDLLVAPVLREAKRSRDVELPKGTWYDYWTDSAFTGGARVTVSAPPEKLPLFVRAGAVIPTGPVMQFTDAAPINPLTLSAYPPENRNKISSPYYEDDGHSLRYRSGEFLSRTISQMRTPDSIHIILSATEGSYTPPKRQVVVKIHNCSLLPTSVTLNGRKLGSLSKGRPGEGWTFDRRTKVMAVIFSEGEQRIDLEVVGP